MVPRRRRLHFSAMRVIAMILVVAGLMVGCGDEAHELRDDVGRFVAKKDVEYHRLVSQIRHAAGHERVVAERIPLEAERFLNWRKREWWVLRDTFAYHMLYEWGAIERLSSDAARHYGYEIENFPRAPEDIMRFFQRAGPEWRNLVQDVTVFLEWRDREGIPMQRDLRNFYRKAGDEVARLGRDVESFLRWREREYNKLVSNGQRFFDHAAVEYQRLQDGLERFRAERSREGQLLVADFKNFWGERRAEVPRLMDDVWRFQAMEAQQMARLNDDLKRFALQRRREYLNLLDDIERFQITESERLPRMLADLERFFTRYEREVAPLSAGVKRFWRHNIEAGHFLVEDVKRFFAKAGPEVDELQAGMRRFIAFGSVEWQRLNAAVRRFTLQGYDPAFGDSVLPYATETPYRSFDHNQLAPLRRETNTGL